MITSAALENNIRSFHEVENIVGAMKAYAGVAVRKAEEIVRNIRVCEESALQALGSIVAQCPQLSPGRDGDGRRIFVAFGSSMGLCGMYNENILEGVAAVCTGDDALCVVGRRLHLLAESRGMACATHLEAPSSVDGIKAALQESVARIREIYSREEYYTLILVFTTVEANRADIAVEQVLPPDFARAGAALPTGEPTLIYDEPENLFSGILEEFLSTSLFRCYVESLRSENWYRLRTMEGASENLKRRVQELRSLYNYVRQEEVTEEMLEILGGGMLFR
jgi:F-type H+-transporting ATPase subunit gamma